MLSPASVHSANILIVDDQQVNITVLQHLLQSAGYTAVSATSDARAVAAMHRVQRYDLIVLDLNMPEMDGFQVLDSLRQIESEPYLPVLVVSAEQGYKLRALEAGAKDFICKPFDYGELLSRIRNMLEVRLLYTGARDNGARMAGHDALTGLPNRGLFSGNLAPALAAAWPRASALLLLDLAGFTSVNDTLGHLAGDEVLRQFAARLAPLAATPACLARFGGDEFALLLPALAGPHEAAAAVARITAAMQAPFQLPGGDLALSVNIGVALCPGDAEDAATLVQYADIALHQAKQDGRDGCRFFTDALNAGARRRYELEHALRLAHARGEFELYYQPKVQLSTGRMTGAEALLRWHRPGHGVVSPAEFIPLLESTGLIVPVGAWAIDQACRQIAQWSRQGAAPLQVAVNVASAQFASDGLVQLVGDAIAAHGIEAGLLSLEVTESALIEDVARTAASLKQLRAMGVRIAIDDFGTGYSSLAYLKRFPVDTLKIDIAFIREVTSSPDDAAVVDAIIAMAHSLNLDVVAEGVETAAQAAYLARRRCDQIQGYFFSRPLPAPPLDEQRRPDPRPAARC
jgi:diguanylate cyclase (GGDEF)-like protein